MEKRYRVSRNLDTEVSYATTKIENALHEALEGADDIFIGVLESRFNKLLDLEKDLSIDSAGVFCVSSRYYELACECRDYYRMKH